MAKKFWELFFLFQNIFGAFGQIDNFIAAAVCEKTPQTGDISAEGGDRNPMLRAKFPNLDRLPRDEIFVHSEKDVTLVHVFVS